MESVDQAILQTLAGILYFGIALLLYFLPTIIAFKRGHH